MSARAFEVDQREDAFWWHGSLYRIKARGSATGGAIGVVDATLYRGFGPALHVHHHEDEAFYVLEGEIRFRVRDDEFVGGPGRWVWAPRLVPHTFTVESETARALILFTPGGFEGMFEAGGLPVSESPGPPAQEYDLAHTLTVADRFGLEVVGPRL
jgi:mannose-6-phosphate isomerase-like protein (cupin superfamily)